MQNKPSFDSVASHPSFLGASPEKRSQIRTQYFDKFIAPEIGDGMDASKVRATFEQRTSELLLNDSKIDNIQGVSGEDAQAAIDNSKTWLQGVATPEQIDFYKQQGKIGTIEAFQRMNKWDIVPFLNGISVAEDVSILNKINKMADGQQISSDDEAEVREFVEDMIELEARGMTLGGKILQTGLESLAFGLEIGVAGALTAGIGGGAAAVRKGGVEAARQTTSAKIKEAAKRAGVATAFMPHRVVGAYADRAIGEQIAITEVGDVIFKKAQRAPATAAMMAVGDVLVENITEQAGAVVAKPLSKLTGKASDIIIPKGLTSGFRRAVKETTGLEINDALSQFGFNGLLAELGEERLGDVIRFATGLDGSEEEGFDGFINALVPDGEQLLVEIGAISIFGAGSRAAVGLQNVLIKDRGMKPKEAKETVQNMTETDIRNQLEKLSEGEAAEIGSKTKQSILKRLDRAVRLPSRSRQRVEELLVGINELTPTDRAQVLDRVKQLDPTGQVVESRKKYLLDRAEILESQLDDKIRQRDAATDGRVVRGLNNDIKELQGDIIELDQELGGIVTAFDDASVINTISDNAQLLDTKKKVTKQVADANTRILTESRAVFRRAQSTALQDSKKAQTQLIDFLAATGLPKASVNKFTKTIRDANTPDKLRKAMPRVQKRVTTEIRRAQRKKLNAFLKDTLKKTKPKKQSGIKRSKFDAATQAKLDMLRETISLKKTEAQKRLDQRMAEGFENFDATDNALLSLVADGADAPVDRLFQVGVELSNLIAGGAEAKALSTFARQNDIAVVQGKVIDAIDPAKVDERLTKRQGRTKFGRILQRRRDEAGTAFSQWNLVWESKLETAFRTKNNQLVRDLLDNDLNFMDEYQDMVTAQNERLRSFFNKVRKRTGLSDSQIHSKMWRNSTSIVELKAGNVFNLNVPVDDNGVPSRERRSVVEFTRSEMITVWAQSQNPEVKERLMAAEGNGYTQEVFAAIEANMTKQDRAVAEAMLEFFSEYYPDIAAKAEQRFGIAPPSIQNYVPILADTVENDANVQQTNFIDGALALGSGKLPSFLKERVSTTGKISKMPYEQILMGHIHEAEYFLNVSDKADLVAKVFADKDVRELLENSTNKPFVDGIIRDTKFFVDRGRMEGGVSMPALNALLRNFSASTLGTPNFSITLKQLTSFPAFAEDVKSKDFISGLFEFAKNPKKALKVLSDSPTIVNRWGSLEQMDVGFQEIANDKSIFNVLGRFPKLSRIVFLPVKLGDLGAVSVGGFARYSALRKQGKSHADAIRDVGLIIERTQQSTNPTQLSELVRQKAFMARLLSRFMSAPMALMRAELRAMNEFARGRINKTEFAKRFAIYHFIIPNLFLQVATAGNPEDDEIVATNILGSFNGVLLLGSVATSVISSLVDGDSFDVEPINPFELYNSLFDVLQSLRKSEFDMEDFLDAQDGIKAATGVIDGLTGLPAENLYESVTGIRDADGLEAAKLGIGYSPRIAEREE